MNRIGGPLCGQVRPVVAGDATRLSAGCRARFPRALHSGRHAGLKVTGRSHPRRIVKHQKLKLQPDIARLVGSYMATLGRAISEDERRDFELAAELLEQIGADLERILEERPR